MRRAYQLLFFLHLIIGVMAIKWGLSAMIFPNKPFWGVTAAELSNYIGLSNFFLLGLGIFLVLGLGNLFSAVRLIFNFLPNLVMSFGTQGVISLAMSGGLLYLLHSRYEILQELDRFMLVYSGIGLIKFAISLVMTLWIFLYPGLLLMRILRNPEDFR